MVGLPTSTRRRVAGLRREEVALLAGVSVDYYTRLERGNLAGASPEVAALVGELSTASRDFSRMWARHDVLYTCHGSKVIHHPEVGDIELAYEPAAMSTDPDLTVLLYAAEPGSPSADALRLLDSWSATLTSDRLAGQEAGQVSSSSGSVPASR